MRSMTNAEHHEPVSQPPDAVDLVGRVIIGALALFVVVCLWLAFWAWQLFAFLFRTTLLILGIAIAAAALSGCATSHGSSPATILPQVCWPDDPACDHLQLSPDFVDSLIFGTVDVQGGAQIKRR